jgi:hypothetical protein
MNERILKIAEQAWDETAVSRDFGHPVSFAEKLAELIVKECADLYENSADTWFGETTKDVLRAYAVMLREHFGIKE